jgi:addiction module HigA family antidote
MREPILADSTAPPSPGTTLLREFLEPLGLSISDFAARIGAPRLAVSEIVNDRRAISPVMAIRLGHALGVSDEFWLKLQVATDLYRARQSAEARSIAALAPIVEGDGTSEIPRMHRATRRKPPGPKPGSPRRDLLHSAIR